LTGFFGTNFGWLANHFDGLTALLALGVSLLIANVVAAIIWFRKRRLL